jgi:hypothetical protein
MIFDWHVRLHDRSECLTRVRVCFKPHLCGLCGLPVKFSVLSVLCVFVVKFSGILKRRFGRFRHLSETALAILGKQSESHRLSLRERVPRPMVRVLESWGAGP